MGPLDGVREIKSKEYQHGPADRGPAAGTRSQLSASLGPSARPGSDFGAVQTFSLTRQIDILCQPRDGEAARDAQAQAGSSELGRGWGQGKEAASIWSCLLGPPPALTLLQYAPPPR